MSVQKYRVEIFSDHFESRGGVQHALEVWAYSAADAVYQVELNHCSKSQVMREGKWTNTSRVLTVNPWIEPDAVLRK